MTNAQRSVLITAAPQHQGLGCVAETDGVVHAEFNDGTFVSLDVDGEAFDSGFESIFAILEAMDF
jgi:hypothetical protein